jgi:predicted DNA-binding transcriptional regulator YafY
VAAHLAELLEAVERRAVIELSYADAAGKPSVRSVWPLGALFSAQAWTLVAWCELREDFRSFRLDRIVSVRASARRYPVEQGRTLQDFFHDMHSRYGIATSDFDPDR